MSAKLSMQFRLPFRLEQEGDLYISICDVLDVRSQGETKEQAAAMLVEALQLFLETCIEEGTVEAVLRESGFRPMLEGQEDIEDDADYLDVPVSLLLANDLGGQHAS